MQSKKTLPIVPETGTADSSTTHTIHAIVSVGIATMNMLENLLPTAASEVERESKILSESFISLVKMLEEQNCMIELLLNKHSFPLPPGEEDLLSEAKPNLGNPVRGGTLSHCAPAPPHPTLSRRERA